MDGCVWVGLFVSAVWMDGWEVAGRGEGGEGGGGEGVRESPVEGK